MDELQRDLHQRLRGEMIANHQQVAALTRPLDPEQLVRRPAPGAWSVGHVLEHLLLMDELFAKPTAALVHGGRRDAGAAMRIYRSTFVGNLIANTLAKPKPVSAPSAGKPGTPRPAIVEAFLANDTRVLSVMDDAASLDWNAIRFRPPVAPWLPLKMNLGDGFRIYAVHVRRHIGQIERVVETIQ